MTDLLAELVREGRACAHGVIRAELLSGARSEKDYAKLSALFFYAPLLPDPADLWDRVARTRFRLARQGVQAAVADLIIALSAEEHQDPLLTLDGDYRLFQKAIKLEILSL